MLDNQACTIAVAEADGTDEKSFDFKPKFLCFKKYPKTSTAKAYADHIVELIQQSEQRAKQRKPADQIIFQQQVYALASEVACFLLQRLDETHVLHFNRSIKRIGSRHACDAPFVTRRLAKVVDAMIGLGLVTQELGRKHPKAKRGVATKIFPTRALGEVIVKSDVALDDFKTLKPRQPIVLKEPKNESGKGKRITFAETDETKRLTQEVDEINQWIAEADIRFDHVAADTKPVDVSRTYLERTFTGGSFKFHGRLYGGFWQEMKKEHRRDGLTINGECVAGLDYSATIVRLAYSHAAAELPASDDFYAIPGYNTEDPDVRKGIKAFVSALFFQTKSLKRTPDKIAKLFPTPIDGPKLKAAIMDFHQGIAHLLDTNVGHELWINESNLLIEVLKRLRVQGIVALPVHDCLIVPWSVRDHVKDVMESTHFQMLGIRGLVRPEW